ncbi:hypothetical protein [Paenibacillus luteus]|uniref:hypothetical protein n=1 Tax=Paenibacillus luteus TaxID=2545753 RepID=UPI0019D5827A|nr:hypothetical protein [Paenibacillus luteus]
MVYLFIFIISAILASLNVTLPYIFGNGFLIAVLFLGVPYCYMLFRETNMDRLEKFLIRQRRKPALYLFYVSANRQDEEFERVIDQLLRKYKQPARQALYKVVHGVYHKNISTLKNEIPHIRPIQYRQYYEAYVQIEEGKLEQARASAAQMAKPWMRYALLCEIELKSGNRSEAIALARETLRHCKGLQRYLVHKGYELELPEAVA